MPNEYKNHTPEQLLYHTWFIWCHNQDDNIPIMVELTDIPKFVPEEAPNSGRVFGIKWTDQRSLRPGTYQSPVHMCSTVIARSLHIPLPHAELAVHRAKEATKEVLGRFLDIEKKKIELDAEDLGAEVADALRGLVDRLIKGVDTIS